MHTSASSVGQRDQVAAALQQTGKGDTGTIETLNHKPLVHGCLATSAIRTAAWMR